MCDMEAKQEKKMSLSLTENSISLIRVWVNKAKGDGLETIYRHGNWKCIYGP